MSVVDDILTVVQSRLELIHTDNGYANTTTGVYRPVRHGGHPIENNAIIVTHDQIEQDEELSHAGNPPSIAWVLPVNINGIVMTDNEDLEPIDSRLADLGTDMQKAITDVASNWHQFGGNAINAEIGPLLPMLPGDDDAFGIRFKLRITYRVQETNPNTLAG